MNTKRIPILLLALTLFVARPAKALDTEELLALVAMPLAVAAVAEIADVPREPLFELVSLLNDANVPPEPFIEVVRYSPVALVADSEPDFIEYVRLQTTQGTTGLPLVRLIETEYREYGLSGVNLLVEAPRLVEVREDFVPVIVRQRVIERRNHPHGGPPGQLKKDLGYQTGAEVVHGAARGRNNRLSDDRSKPAKVKVQTKQKGDERGIRERDRRVDRPERPAKIRNEKAERPREPKGPKGNPGRGREDGGNRGEGKNKGKGKS